MAARNPNDIMRQLMANVLRNFHRNSPHPEADSEDLTQAVAALMRIPYDPLLTQADPTDLNRIEPHDTLFDVREFLLKEPGKGSDEALYMRVLRALYAERSKPTRDDEGWCDMGTAPKSPKAKGGGPMIMGWGRYRHHPEEPESSFFMRWFDGEYPGWYAGTSPICSEFAPRAWRPLLGGPR